MLLNYWNNLSIYRKDWDMFATWIICNISTTLHITASNLVIVAPILHFRGNSFIILQRSNTFCLPLRHFRLTQKLMMDSNLEQHETQSTVSVFITLLSETPVLQHLNKSLGLEKVFILCWNCLGTSVKVPSL